MKIHDRLARHTVQQCCSYSSDFAEARLKICTTGGTRLEAKKWLQTDEADYTEQSEGNLGNRMWTAMENAFSEGFKKVIIVGTDCPDLDVEILSEATSLLDEFDVVFGPAVDGGYYLIGSRIPIASLFENIPWGTADVLKRSTAAANKQELLVAKLRMLCDIDLPEDLAYAEESLAKSKIHP